MLQFILKWYLCKIQMMQNCNLKTCIIGGAFRPELPLTTRTIAYEGSNNGIINYYYVNVEIRFTADFLLSLRPFLKVQRGIPSQVNVTAKFFSSNKWCSRKMSSAETV
ncbi:hypothetical protein AVEN_86684-1 [Araneus ventricosus]|uniref:Uncharacterized protein n=1 Tax=Araneus ventricosus TaxID=182803 RepID=A0A4Y2VR13_ARAVE|nr:hypothetical protein AVEN_86684-1 [Araneus ventricosus]